MTLYEGQTGKNYEVTGLKLSDPVMRRLEALGIFEGTKIHILNNKKKGAVIIKARGARWALGGEMAQGIEVKEYTDEEVH